MTPILLTMMEDGTGHLVYGRDTQIIAKHFDEPDDPLEFLAWCSAHSVAATNLFSLLIHYRGGRCWVINPEDEEAAFLLKLLWL